MRDLPYLCELRHSPSMPLAVAHLVAKSPSIYLMSDITEALRVLSARVRTMEATVITGSACCDEDHPLKTLSPAEVFELMEGW